jgi:hypothetical protein
MSIETGALPILFKAGDDVPEWLFKPDFAYKSFTFEVDVEVYACGEGGYVMYPLQELNGKSLLYLDPMDKEIDGNIEGAPTHVYTAPLIKGGGGGL